MATMPIRVTLPPSTIVGQPNGAVPEHLLEIVDRNSYLYKMASFPARGMRALHAAILLKFGVMMSTTGRGRSFKMQYDLFLSRHHQVTLAQYNQIPSGEAKRRIWNQAPSYGFWSVYWALNSGQAAAAVPGTSPHGLWCADDLALPDDLDADTNPEGIGERPDILNWLYDNEMEFGFAHSLKSETWHIQWFVGDFMPQRVLDYEKGTVHTPPHPELPQYPVQPVYDDDMPTLYRDKRFANVFLVNGDVTTVGGELFASLVARGVTQVAGVHDQSLISYMRKSMIKMAQMVPAGVEPGTPPFSPPSDLQGE